MARIGDRSGACRNFVGRPKGKRRLRSRWKYNIKMDLQELRRGGKNWIDLAQNRDRWRALVNVVMNIRV